MQYFVLPHCCIAFNAKVASSALASSIVRKYHPERLEESMSKYEQTWSQFSDEFKQSLPESFQRMFKADKDDSISFWQNLCTITRNPDKPILLAFREPVARFISGAAYLEQDVEKLLQGLENDDQGYVLEKLPMSIRNNTHFIKQSWLIKDNTKIYQFPTELEQLCKDANLDWPLPKVNETKQEKPSLNENQVERIKNYYHEDVQIWNSLVMKNKINHS